MELGLSDREVKRTFSFLLLQTTSWAGKTEHGWLVCDDICLCFCSLLFCDILLDIDRQNTKVHETQASQHASAGRWRNARHRTLGTTCI